MAVGAFIDLAGSYLSQNIHLMPTRCCPQVKRSRSKGGLAGPDGTKSVFGQMCAKMSSFSPDSLLLPHRVWKVKFVGRSSTVKTSSCAECLNSWTFFFFLPQASPWTTAAAATANRLQKCARSCKTVSRHCSSSLPMGATSRAPTGTVSSSTPQPSPLFT